MTVIAYRKSGLAALYMFTLVLSIILIVIGLTKDKLFILAGVLTGAISLYVLIGYFRTPKEAIRLADEMTLELPHGNRVKLSDVYDVSYKRASARGIQYKWGDVILSTKYGTFKVKYVAECEAVSKDITMRTFRVKK